MRISDQIKCVDFPCGDIVTNSYAVPGIDIDPLGTRLIMISEASPLDHKNQFYAPGKPFYLETALQAFNDSGIAASSIDDILSLVVFILLLL
ncbi:MAG: hypothetical protein SWO11_16325 [Thermodesulfobacteriota bacterium]|nr:hypothetical protein [Thermodesulfobacteriota bacterium]